MNPPLSRRAAAEFAGTAFLVAAVIGSGIMGERLSGGNVALALLANTIATGAALISLIACFGRVSGAHLNPVVTVVSAVAGEFPWADVPHYLAGQLLGGMCGTISAHLMFGVRMFSLGTHERAGGPQIFSEAVATFGLVCVIWGCVRSRPGIVPFAVGAYISAAYWFTASTSFANPAVTIARGFSETFAGIRPRDVPWFVAAQFTGGFLALMFVRWLHLSSIVSIQAPQESPRQSSLPDVS
jgi:glycerol uptake facilitator-like aquaporin